ncbi:MAG: hypothetical protein ACKVW3_01930 [Phycisphaerales bacterium]
MAALVGIATLMFVLGFAFCLVMSRFLQTVQTKEMSRLSAEVATLAAGQRDLVILKSLSADVAALVARAQPVSALGVVPPPPRRERPPESVQGPPLDLSRG